MWWDYLRIVDRLTFGHHSMWWLVNVMNRTCCYLYSTPLIMGNTLLQVVFSIIGYVKGLATINISMHSMSTISTIDYALNLTTIN